MRSRLVAALALVTLVAVAPVATVATVGPGLSTPEATASVGSGENASTSGSNPAAPEDPKTDVIGWENGYWYNESINVDQSDGLNDSELDAVVGRAMARVEQIRKLEFEEDVPVRIISREEYREQVAGGSGDIPDDAALHQNVKFEALFMIGENTSAIKEQQSTLSASVLGYYSPSGNQIVIVSENTTSPKLDEITLSQELFHALQDQVFNAFQKSTPTREDHNAYDGIIEGDGNYVDYLYQQRCDAEWDCLLPDESPGGGGGDVHLGLFLIQFQPYSDGPAFVQEIREAGGWDAVNAIYENPPKSTEQTIHPDKYGSDEPTEVTVEDTSTDRWRIPTTGGVPYASFGEAGIFSMFMYPSIASNSNDVILDLQTLLNYDSSGDLKDIDPYNYDSQYSAGWDGDRLYPYVTEDSAETNETGYVWKIVWDSESDADEFIEGYEELLAWHGGQEQADNLWIVPEGEFADAFYIQKQGDTVTIVNAPTVDELSEIRQDADIPTDQETTTATATATATATTQVTETTTAGTAESTTAPPTDTTTTSSASGPGFGPLAAVVAAIVSVLLVRRLRG